MQFKTEPPNYEPDENGLVGVSADTAAGAGVEPGDSVAVQGDEKKEEAPKQAAPAAPKSNDSL